MSKLRNGSKGDSNPGSLDCESGILPLSYRAPFIITVISLFRHQTQKEKLKLHSVVFTGSKASTCNTIYTIICLKSVWRRSHNAVRNSGSIASGDVSN